MGRYSNGRNYLDFLGMMLGTAVSTENGFAWGGATTNNDFIPAHSTFIDGLVPAVKQQVDSYLDQSRQDDPATTLFIIMVGYNDFWWFVKRKEYSISALTSVARQVATNMFRSAATLYSQAGARRFLIANIVDMLLHPDAATKTAEQRAAYGILSKEFEAFFDAKLAKFATTYADADVTKFDVNSLFVEITTSPSCFGYDNVVAACANGTRLCENPYGALWIDEWHFSTQTHKRVADLALAALSS